MRAFAAIVKAAGVLIVKLADVYKWCYSWKDQKQLPFLD